MRIEHQANTDSDVSGSLYKGGRSDDDLEQELHKNVEEEVPTKEEGEDAPAKQKGCKERGPRRPPKESWPEGPGPAKTSEGAVAMSYALCVGPALQHAASTALTWASLQVQQDDALLASLVKSQLCGSGLARDAEADTWR